MKKLIGIIFGIMVLGLGGYFVYVNYIKEEVPKKIVEEEKAYISDYYVYGNHLNMTGFLEINDKSYKEIKLTMYNGEDKDIDLLAEIKDNKVNFYLSEYVNEGLYLDEIERGTYYLFLKLIYDDPEKEDKDIVKYYVLSNDTEYKDVTYYTLSKFNNKIVIDYINDYETMAFNVVENKDKGIYDITIDPGHGGMDGGGSSNDYKETDFTMSISKKVKESLESAGVKVKLTHDEGDLSSNDVLDEYNEHGRAVIPNEVKSKYTFSIHINKNVSSKVRGIEVYTPKGITYDLAKSLADNITSYSGLGYSSNRIYKMYDGVYTHNFTESEIASSLQGYEDKGYKPYNVTTNSNYLYMIRETGGYMTGAYIDDSNLSKVGVNPYYNSNIGNETYLLELGYISNSSDVDILLNSEEEIASAIADAIKKELGI